MTGVKIKLWPILLVAAIVVGGFAYATGVLGGGGRTVTFIASWFASDHDKKQHVGTDSAHVTWHILPGGAIHNQMHYGGYYRGTTEVTKPGVYSVVYNVTTDRPTKLGCRVTISDGKTYRDPKPDDANPATGKCNIVASFTVSAPK